MGNSSSSSSSRHQEEFVDYGSLIPQGVYTGPRDWNQEIVSQLIVSRKLAPFYRPLEDYEDSWDDDQILAARKELPQSEHNEPPPPTFPRSSSKRPAAVKEFRPEAAVYRGAVECPICFLYYPRNINHSRCCDQAICTECFVQIKRAEPTTTHLISEPAACPYCVQENFGVVYKPPPWRSGIGSDGTTPLSQHFDPSPPTATHKRRQHSYSADSPEVVTTDQIRPDWEAKLAAVRAAVARRANRRIIMRQVGDRLIPVGIGRIQTPEEAAGEAANGGSRRRRHNHDQYVGVGGQDLEELMLMEAMRLSLLEHEEYQRKEAEEKRKKEEAERAQASQGEPGPSTTETRNSASEQASPEQSSSAPSKPESSSSSRQPQSPPPFSTLNAALLSAGTASAIISPATESSNSKLPVPESNSNVPSASTSTSGARSTSSSMFLPDPSLAGLRINYGQLPSSPESGSAIPLLSQAGDRKPEGENVNSVNSPLPSASANGASESAGDSSTR